MTAVVKDSGQGDHVHRVQTYRMDARASGYDPRSRGYVYAYVERCRCGATRTVRYPDAHAAGAAHRDAVPEDES